MKCFIKGLLGQDSYDQEGRETCPSIPPIVWSVIGGALFLIMMFLVVMR